MKKNLQIGFQHVLPPEKFQDGAGQHTGAWTRRITTLIDQLGFDAVWAGDHVAFAGPILDPLMQLAQAAALSERLMIGTSVYLLPLRHPAAVAKQAASLDVLSEGRLIFGVGVGGEFPIEFALCGVPVEERGARLSEGIAVLRKLWSGAPVSHDGRFYPFPEVMIEPAPIQPGGPKIWCGGRSEAALRRAGRLADGWISYAITEDRFRQSLETIATAAEAAGRSMAAFDAGHLLFIRLGETREQALDFASDFLSVRYSMDFRRPAERYCALGTAEEVATTIRAFYAAGARHLVCDVLAHQADKEAEVARFGEQVLPLLADLRAS